DTDGDGIGDNSDTDYNSDGLPDDIVFPSQFFSPNGDGINDRFTIIKIESYPNSFLSLYTRSGALIYSKLNYRNTWPSDVNSQTLPEGSYYYILDLNNDGRADEQGWIYLIR
ncbi:MAG: gliding motility-associated C-terminal domain-containing protein, partial [Flavobacteriaceae bacterium]